MATRQRKRRVRAAAGEEDYMAAHRPAADPCAFLVKVLLFGGIVGTLMLKHTGNSGRAPRSLLASRTRPRAARRLCNQSVAQPRVCSCVCACLCWKDEQRGPRRTARWPRAPSPTAAAAPRTSVTMLQKASSMRMFDHVEALQAWTITCASRPPLAAGKAGSSTPRASD